MLFFTFFLQRLNTIKNYIEKRNGILRKNRGGGVVPLHGGRGGKKLPNHPYVINEWPLLVL